MEMTQSTRPCAREVLQNRTDVSPSGRCRFGKEQDDSNPRLYFALYFSCKIERLPESLDWLFIGFIITSQESHTTTQTIQKSLPDG